jgi:hypothetical protein
MNEPILFFFLLNKERIFCPETPCIELDLEAFRRFVGFVFVFDHEEGASSTVNYSISGEKTIAISE